ncbi:MAG TPA: prephenate dehydrogenase/arogenate dehydrogenase family protein [Myxococcota bacterium]|nr:prephenate dehydrogenase/arogenate dehydrogenase family protein [Myxococcota bacterium]
MGSKLEKVIKQCRSAISEIDREIFSALKKREQLSLEIGRAKRDLSIPDRDSKREKEVFENAVLMAKGLDLPKDFAIALQKLIVEASLSCQEQDRIKNSDDDVKKSVAVVGGAGRLGQWLYRFFSDSGHEVSVIDLVHPGFPCQYSTELEPSADSYDIIAVATPIRISNDILGQIYALKLKHPTIFDTSSVKAPVYQSLLKLKENGVRVTSLHPMFGPSVNLLYGKHVIRTSLGVKEADDLVSEIFRATPLQVVDMSIDEHDTIIAILLSLSHMINIVFIRALAESQFSVEYLEKFSSPTFSNLLAVAKKVMSENPQLYFEIQALNPHTQKTHQQLSQAMTEVTSAVAQFDEEKFVAIMTEGEEFLRG